MATLAGRSDFGGWDAAKDIGTERQLDSSYYLRRAEGSGKWKSGEYLKEMEMRQGNYESNSALLPRRKAAGEMYDLGTW